MSAAIAPNPNDPQAPLGMPARPWWIGYIRQLHLDIPLAVESGGTGKNTPLDASDIAETSTLKILTATERTKLAGIAENAEVNTVDSVAGKTGDVTLDADDVAPTSTKLWMSDTQSTKLAGIAEGAEVNTVDSVAGKTGDVTLDADDVAPTSTKLWMSDTQSTKLAGIAEGAEVNTVDSVAGKTGDVTLDADDVAPTSTKLWMSDTQSTKLAGIAEGAEVNTVDSVAGKTGDVTLDADDVAPTSTKLWMSDTQQSMIEGLADSLAAKAPLASPALTGTPTAPTAAEGTNTTQIATTAFVQDALTEISIDADPYSVKLTGNQSIGGIKTFTSSPVLPTPAAGDYSTKGATTAFCGNFNKKWTYAYTELNGAAISASAWNMHAFGASGTLTLPLASSVASGVQVAAIVVKGGAEVVLTRSGSDQFVTPKGLTTTYTLRGNGSSIVLVRVTESAWACLGAPDKLIEKALEGALLTNGRPSGPTATGTTGMARFDANYFYVCTATNTWVRFAKDGSWT